MEDREWPPNVPRASDRALVPPAWLAAGVLLFVLSPLAAWTVAALPGDRDWAAVVWPVGWMASLTLVMGGSYLRTRRRVK